MKDMAALFGSNSVLGVDLLHATSTILNNARVEDLDLTKVLQI